MSRSHLLKSDSACLSESARFWDELHAQPRFRPVYPNDHVVRFLMRHQEGLFRQAQRPQALDIGVGSGRHTALVAELGFDAYGVDISTVGLEHARRRLHKENREATLLNASMCDLPFGANRFDVAVSFGTFYYANRNQMDWAIAELHRVLKPRGKGFVVLRTTDDRFGKDWRLELNTLHLDIAETNEFGTIQRFLAEEEAPRYFSRFSTVSFEKTDTTSNGR